MAPSTVSLVTVSSGPSGTRRVRILLPRIDCLVDNARYWSPDDLPPLAGQDLRGLSRPKIGKIVRPVRRWTAHDHRAARRCCQRDEAELAEILGDPV
jgi:hypothetical protein